MSVRRFKSTKESLRVLIHISTRANLESVKLRARHCGSEALLLAILGEEDSVAAHELRKAGLSLEAARSAMEDLFDFDRRRIDSVLSAFSGPQKSANFKSILNQSEEIALAHEAEGIQVEHILLALLMNHNSGAAKLLESFEIDRRALYEELLRSMANARTP